MSAILSASGHCESGPRGVCDQSLFLERQSAHETCRVSADFFIYHRTLIAMILMTHLMIVASSPGAESQCSISGCARRRSFRLAPFPATARALPCARFFS